MYWDTSKPILLEKSPSNIIRSKEIETIFNPSFFIILIRDPYAFAHSLIKRNKQDATSAANFVVKCLKYQMNNHLNLNNRILIKYEDLVQNPILESEKLIKFIPQLERLNTEKEFNAHNPLNNKTSIKDFNNQKIKELKPQEIDEMNIVFSSNKEVLCYFGYQLI